MIGHAIAAIFAARTAQDAARAHAAALQQAMIYGGGVIEHRTRNNRASFRSVNIYELRPPRSPTWWDAFKPLALPLFYASTIVGVGALIFFALRLAIMGPVGP